MDELHAAIADYLRRQRRPRWRGPRGFTCRDCGRPVAEEDHGLSMPFAMLWEVACCPACYRPPLPPEMTSDAGDHPLRGLRAEFVPRCRICGAPVDDDGGVNNLAHMRAVRECALHYAPF